MEARLHTPTAEAPVLAASAAVAPSAVDLLTAVAGFGGLGLAAALGSGSAALTAANAPGALLTSAGALVLTGPALIVVHQFLKFNASPQSLVVALGRGFALTGRLALGLVPMVLFFSATSGAWAPILLGCLALLAVVGLHATVTYLVQAEEAGGGDIVARTHMWVVSAGWALLTLLTALRIAFDAFRFA